MHLIAHAPALPLPVYGYAWSHGMDCIAAEASQYIMPLASYSTAEIKLIPTVEAYHRLVRLQDLRLKVLRTLLLEEDIFPHGIPYMPRSSSTTPLTFRCPQQDTEHVLHMNV